MDSPETFIRTSPSFSVNMNEDCRRVHKPASGPHSFTNTNYPNQGNLRDKPETYLNTPSHVGAPQTSRTTEAIIGEN